MRISKAVPAILISVCVLVLCSQPVLSQSLAPGRVSRAVTSKKKESIKAESTGTAPTSTDCNTIMNNLHSWAPLARVDQTVIEKPNDSSSQQIVIDCFYQTVGAVSALNRVKFLYGIGGGDSKTLAADLMSIQFPYGLQATLGSSVTMGTSTTNTVTTTTNNKQSTAQQTADTPETAISKLESAGGDLYVRFDYPIAFKNSDNSRLTGTLFSVSKLGANFSGFGSEATITEANEYNWNSSLEAYGEWRAFKDAGLVYGDVRSGYQYVQPDFARAVGLAGKHNFALTQIAAGIEFNQLLRIGFQRFIGPAAALGTSKTELSKWHLVLDIVPKKKKGD